MRIYRNQIFLGLLGILLLVDVKFPEQIPVENESLNIAGINGKHLQQGEKVIKRSWRWLKSCVGYEDDITKVVKSPPKVVSNQVVVNATKLIESSEWLKSNLITIRSNEDVLIVIKKYLQKYRTNECGQKVIECVKTSDDDVKIFLYENNRLSKEFDKVIKSADNIRWRNVAEYDFGAIKEEFFVGSDGMEYVRFIIPKRPQYILGGIYGPRVYECMIFNLPKDIEGRWQNFKELLIAFVNDIMHRPAQLWDEYMFNTRLEKIQLSSRDIKEIDCYMFAQVEKNDQNEIHGYNYRDIA